MDEPLPGGRMTDGLVRRGDTVLRPLGPWSPAVHEILSHLESVGFAGAPRVLGVEGDQEVLSFVAGDVPLDSNWQPGRGFRLPAYARSSRALMEAGRLVRSLHDAASGFVPAIVDYRFHPHPPRAGEIVSHGDLGPWNTVYRDGSPIAFIDWDGAQPVDPLVELAAAAWAFVPLQPPDRLRFAGFDPLPGLGSRLRQFVDAYGLVDRRSIIRALTTCKLREAERIAYWPVGTVGAAAAFEYLAGELRWLATIAGDLAQALD